MDHQQWLGCTLREIAAEKGGIIKPNVPIVSGPQFTEVRAVLERIAAEQSAPILYVEVPVDGLSIGLAGSHQRMNAAIAIEAIRKAGIHVSPSALKEGLANVYWPGRFQRINERIYSGRGAQPGRRKVRG